MVRAATAEQRERRDLVSGEVMDESRLIRFVAAPDGGVAPDLAARLPGRGLWVEARRESVETAARKNLFARAARARLTVPADLADQVERLLARRCLDLLGLARREGVLISGFEKAAAAIRAGQAAWLIEAADGSADGRGKLLSIAGRTQNPPRVCGAFGVEDLSLALGLENAIHTVLLAGRRAGRWTDEVGRLAGFRPLLPPDWPPLRPAGGQERDQEDAFDGRGAASRKGGGV